MCHWLLDIALSSNVSWQFALLDKVISHKQWNIGVHECQLMFQGIMQLDYKVLLFTQFYALAVFQFP